MDENLKEKINNKLKNIKIDNLDDFKIFPKDISGMEINNGNIQFALEIDEKFKSVADQLYKDIEKEILELQGVNSVTIILTAHKSLTAKQDTEVIDEKKIPGIDKIIAVASGKGGVQKTVQSLLNAKNVNLISQTELIVEELRLAINEIGRLTGAVDVEEYLEVIFRDFCIGK